MIRQNVLPLISEQDVSSRVQALGRQIALDYSGKDLLLLGLLNGVFPFFADLARAVDLDFQVCFLRVSSYGHAQVSSGDVWIANNLDTGVQDKHVLIVEDIVDTGLTLAEVIKLLLRHSPASIRVCTMLDKPSRRVIEVSLDYVGFTIEDHYVVGYGMDAAGLFRNLPYVGIFHEKPIV